MVKQMQNSMINKKIAQKVKSHWPAIILAVVMGFLVFSPNIYAIAGLGLGNFQGVFPTFNKDEIHYQAMTKEVAEGRFRLGNTYLFEHKGKPGMQAPLAELILAAEAKLFGLAVPSVFALNDFFVTVINFLLLYAFFCLLAKKKGIALVLSSLFYLFFLYNFGRATNPQFSFMFFALGLIFVHKTFSQALSKKTLAYAGAAGAVTGALVYMYLYYWTALAVLYSLNLARLFWQTRSLRKTSPAMLYFPILAGLAIPYLLNHLAARADPAYADTILRFGLLANHWPACYTNVGMAILAGGALILAKKYLSLDKFFYTLSFIAGAVILNWQNVITGQYLQFSSHYYHTTILFAFSGLAIAASGLYARFKETPQKPGLRFFAALLAIVIFFGYAGLRSKNEIIRGLNNKMDPAQTEELQSFAPVFDWLNDNTAAESVVMTNEMMLSAYLPVYTSNNLFSNGYAAYYLVSDEELIERWVIERLLLGEITPDIVNTYHREIWGNKFVDRYQNQAIRNQLLNLMPGVNLKTDELFPDVYAKQVLELRDEITAKGIGDYLKKYRLDYVAVKSGTVNPENLKETVGGNYNLDLAFSADTWEIYKVDRRSNEKILSIIKNAGVLTGVFHDRSGKQFGDLPGIFKGQRF